jgi:peroxiredoxin
VSILTYLVVMLEGVLIDTWVLPIPATFVVSQDGIVKARFIDPDYRKHTAVEDFLAAVKSCGA